MKRRAAFSLVEMIIVLALLGLAFFPLLETVVSGLRSGQVVDQSVRALRLAEEKMEGLRGQSFAAIASEARGAVTAYGSSFPYEREVVVSNVSATLKDVEVRVTWGAGGAGELVSLRTYISSYEATRP